MASLRFHIFLLLLCATSCHCHQQAPLFIFGDSFFDPGNNNYINTTTSFQANFWPYGETFFKYPTGRFSDGRLIPDFIAEYAKLPLIPPYLQPGNHQITDGVNFASAGAGALVETYHGWVVDLKTQLSYFKNIENLLRQKEGDAKAKTLLSRAIYLICIGTNDYLSPLFTKSSLLQSYSKEEYVGMVIGNITTAIKDIYKKGGRKFGFLSLGPFGCAPSVKALDPGSNGSCNGEVTTLLELHNRELSKVLLDLESELKGFKYSNHNWYSSFSERMDNPSKYGFKEAKMACCGSGPYGGILSCGGKRGVKEYHLCDNASEYLFFDFIHPTERANQQFAELMWNGTPTLTGPYNLKTLFELKTLFDL